MLSVIVLAAVVAIAESQTCPACEVGCNTTACFDLEANDLTFNCRRVQSDADDVVNVVLLHGFPEWSLHWIPLLEYWADEEVAVDAVACDLRGYSPDASPDSASEYNYTILQSDVWAIADALNFDTFHLIGHDHGAGLGWTVAANKSDSVSGRVRSYTAISVPHVDVFSDAIYGDAAVEQQAINSNYFNQFALEDSATINDEALSVLFEYGGFTDAESFQKALWWYYGSIGSFIAQPPVIEITVPQDDGEGFVYAVQQAIPLPASNGSAAPMRIGSVPVPTLFACGTDDAYLLCSLPYVDAQEDLVDSTYEVLNVACGHNLISCDGDDDVALTVHETITEFILSITAEPTAQPTESPNGSSALKSVASLSLYGLTCAMVFFAF